MRCEVLTAVLLQIKFVWHAVLCRLFSYSFKDRRLFFLVQAIREKCSCSAWRWRWTGHFFSRRWEIPDDTTSYPRIHESLDGSWDECIVASICIKWAGIAQLVLRLATGWNVRESDPSGGEIFRTRPDRPWGSPSLLVNAYWLSFPGVKRPGRGVNHPSPSSAEVKERVEVLLYSPSGPLWHVLGRN